MEEINNKDLLFAIAQHWTQNDSESVQSHGTLLQKAIEEGHYLKLENKAERDNIIPVDDFDR